MSLEKRSQALWLCAALDTCVGLAYAKGRSSRNHVPMKWVTHHLPFARHRPASPDRDRTTRARQVEPMSILAVLFAMSFQSVAPSMADAAPAAVGEKAIMGEAATERPAEFDDVEALEAFMDGILNTQLVAHEIPGATVSVVKDGKLLLAKGYGWADVETRRPVVADETTFRIASVSKLFVWTAVMQLVEQGKLDLNADVQTYLDFDIPDTFPEPITMTHLLTHTPGFEDRSAGTFVHEPERLVALGKALARDIPARVRPPGRESSYSNYGAALAGYVVERVAGMPFGEYMEKRIFAPLGMEHAHFGPAFSESTSNNLAIGYTVRNARFVPERFEFLSNFAPAGSAVATAVDIAKFMIAHLAKEDGEAKLLRRDTMDLMHTRLFTHHERVRGVAHGFYETRLNGQRIIGHNGALPSFHSNLVLFPEHGVGLFVSYNSDGGAKARRSLLQAFVDRYFPERHAVPPQPPADFAERAGDYVGSYRGNRYAYTTLEKIIALFSESNISATAENTLRLGGAIGDAATYWVEVEPMVFRQIGDKTLGPWFEDLVFQANEDGRVERVFLGNAATMAMHKLRWWETARFQLTLVGVSLVLFLTTIVGTLRRFRGGQSDTSVARIACWLAATVASLNLAFVIGTMMVMTGDLVAQFTEGVPVMARVLLAVAVVASLLSFGLFGFAIVAWKQKLWTRTRRIHYSLMAASSFAFTWFLDYWNLLGFHW